MYEENIEFLFSNPVIMSGIIGNVGEFDQNEETWDSYIERFELFLSCNEIGSTKKVSTLLTVVGVKTFKLLRDLCTPDKPSSKSYDDLVKLIKEHLYPTPSFIAERYRFSLRNQLEHESVAQYIAQLKNLSTHCEFGGSLNDFLRDRLICGIRSESMKQRLLSEANLTFEKAVQITSQIEMAEKSAASLATSGHDSSVRVQRLEAMTRHSAGMRDVTGRTTSRHPSSAPHHHNRQTTLRTFPPVQQQNAVKCNCCGHLGHISKVCKYRGCVCHSCGKKNHLAKVCRSKLSGKSTNFQYSSDKNKFGYKNKHHFVDSVKDVQDETDVIECIGNLFEITEKLEPRPKGVSDIALVNKVKPFKTEVMLEKNIVSFEIDTGASVSVISETFYKENLKFLNLLPTDLKLSSYNNVPILPVGRLEVNVQFENQNKVLNLYVIKNGSHPLMGRDWIKALGVEISFKNNQELFVTKSSVDSKHENLVNKIVTDFPEVFSKELGQCNCDPIKLVLKENSKPKYCKPRALPYTLKAKVEQELNRLVEADVLLPVNSSEYGSPIVPVPKKDGSIRICGDFRYVNSQLEIDRYPIPRVEDLFAEMQKGELFSKIDLSQAYMQLRLDEYSQKICTISTHRGLFSYKRLPYGIASAVGIFERIIEQTLLGLRGVKCFLDDIIISGPDDETHYSRLREVCERLRKVGFTVKQEKCSFFVPKVEFLGFTIDKSGLHTSETKVKAILDAPEPKSVTEVKSFVGLVNYYGKFVPNVSMVLRPLYNLLRKDVPFSFDKDCVIAFKRVKELMCSAPVLAHYDPEAPLILTVDASQYGIGAVLSTIDSEGKERPISYASRTLNQAECNYSQIDKEALACVFFVRKFHQYLYGRRFILKSDHKPLISIFGPKRGLPVFAASRLQRYALFLSGYDFDIKYVKSEDNSADALSRLPLKVTKTEQSTELFWLGTYLHYVQESSMPVSCEQVKLETQKDPLLKKVLGYALYGWPSHVNKDNVELFPYFQRREEIAVEQGILLWGYKIIIPTSLRSYVLNELHASHLGITKMKTVARSYLWYPNLDKDIENLANSCSSCLLERPNPAKSEIHHWHYPSRPWIRLHADHFYFKNKLYLIVIDAFSKWLEVFETSSTSASQTINHFRDLFARFGLPVTVHSDNGSPYNSDEFKTFLKQNGVKHTTSAPYYPRSNGLAENSVSYAKSKLKCAFRDNVNISVALSRILFDYRNSVHMTTNETPAMLMFSRPLRTRLDLLRPNLSRVVEEKQEKQKFYARGSNTRNFCINQTVLVRDYSRSKERWVEGCVIKQLGATMYLVRLGSGIVYKRHVDQLIAVDTGPVSSVKEADDSVTAVSRPIAADKSADQKSRLDVSTADRSLSPSHASVRTADPVTPSWPTLTSPTNVPHTPLARSTPVRRYPQRMRKATNKLDL